ncbi:Crp/Fnr family transcriptional regulator [Pseudobacteriovorax antillogorgiicola]|uniref:Cyclic nucleotide-binding domain-containing protein n=1 Tax=Pseudobacteriovorax antillogorgiicola TaxID=1513793 RepID=A0A1Y6BZ80_9BACT|nr:cyclic nucleotide-binding domain-containing protein [Pseudobacteriovorax antillogorgiicola]TCS52449.1 cyclic nucleotide-binding protein [Pseudobacteriovorax antillogorgiicola]SMF28514.1 Cyclic nucleotide-binding domain-containing protein [Pseudobacteriovorax antillogorgiicola]
MKVKLTEIPIFKYVDQDLAHHLNECSQLIVKDQGQPILLRDEPTPGLFILVAGKVDIFVGNDKEPTFQFPEGEVFGEMSLIDQAKASATIRAAVDQTKLIFVHKEKFEARLKQDSALASGFYKGAAAVLTKRMRLANGKLATEMAQLDSFQEDGSSLIQILNQLSEHCHKALASHRQNSQASARLVKMLAEGSDESRELAAGQTAHGASLTKMSELLDQLVQVSRQAHTPKAS